MNFKALWSSYRGHFFIANPNPFLFPSSVLSLSHDEVAPEKNAQFSYLIISVSFERIYAHASL